MSYIQVQEKLNITRGREPVLIILLSVAAIWLFRRLARSKYVIRAVLRALRHGGPIPRHVAFIMDGNRRWARKAKLEVHQGHARGGEKLIESLEWCLDAGVKVVTVYAFSIENFKRSQNEVDEIMKLCEIKFREMLEHSDSIQRNRVCVRVLGDLSRVSPSLQHLMKKTMASTSKHKDGPQLNICFSYACRYDIASSVSKLVQLCDAGKIRHDDIREGSVASYLCTGYANGGKADTCYPELIVRTSGETRLSDFLLWEGCFSKLAFCNTLWPDLTAWDFVRLIMDYQAEERMRDNRMPFVAKEENSILLENAYEVSRATYFTDIQSYGIQNFGK